MKSPIKTKIRRYTWPQIFPCLFLFNCCAWYNTTLLPIFCHSRQERGNELIQRHPLHPSTHQGNTSCSTKALMNTNPEGLSIKLHILTAAPFVHNVYRLLLCAFEALSLQETKEANESSLNIYQTLFIVFIEEGRNLQSLQLISERWHSLSAYLARQSFLSASATRHYWSLCSRESNLQQIENLLEAHPSYSK